jgi:phosphoglycolate phosphatase
VAFALSFKAMIPCASLGRQRRPAGCLAAVQAQWHPMNLQSLNLQAVMVDLDGTMVDTLGDFEQALNLALADLALPSVARDVVERSVGKGSEHLIQSVLRHQLALPEAAAARAAGRDVESLYPQAWLRYEHHYLAINGQYSRVFDGVIEGLRGLRERGLPLACLTNKPLSFTRPLLASKGLDGFFVQVFGGDSFARKKPHPDPLLGTCAALGTLPAQTLMVGDSSNDAQAANAAGCPVVLMTYGYNHGEPIRQTPALAWLDSLQELLPLL